MRLRAVFGSIILVVLILASGCAKRVPISYDQAQPNAVVQITTISGKVCEGQIQNVSPTHILLKQDKFSKSLTKISRDEISEISGTDFVYHGQGEIISEWEIQKKQKNKNLLYYTLGGAGLSFGASFFIGSLIHRGLDDDDVGKTAMWSTTAAGTAVGTFLFARAGKKRDRFAAIEQIREERFKLAQQKVDSEKAKRHQVQSELSKIKAERDKKNKEIKLLQEQIKKQKKKKN